MLKNLKETAILRFYSFLKIPLIYQCSPQVIELTDEKVVVKFPLNRMTKNHLNSMYFGALSIGADCAGGLIAMRQIQKNGNRVNLVFKDFKADFLKRPEDDVHFICEEGLAIQNLVEQALQTGDRVYLPVNIYATCPNKFGNEPVAKFVLTLSLKVKNSK